MVECTQFGSWMGGGSLASSNPGGVCTCLLAVGAGGACAALIGVESGEKASPGLC